ncbi:MAG: hypothetical protein WCQ90_14990 [Deltaproteobacteria bacterium]
MNLFITLSVAYLMVTLVICLLRSAKDHYELGWIAGGSSYWSFFWPRLKMWLVGVLGVAALNLFMLCGSAINRIGQTAGSGLLAMVLVIFCVAGMMFVLSCAAMPFCASVSEAHEVS